MLPGPPRATVAPVCDCQLCQLPAVRTRGSKASRSRWPSGHRTALGVAVQVSADVKSRPDVRDLEHRPGLRVLVAHLDRHGMRDPLALARAQHETIHHEPDNPTATARVKPQPATRRSSASKSRPAGQAISPLQTRHSARTGADVPARPGRADHPARRRPDRHPAGSLARQATGLAAAAGRSRQVRACSSTDPPLLPAPVRLPRRQGSAVAADTCAQASDEADHGM